MGLARVGYNAKVWQNIRNTRIDALMWMLALFSQKLFQRKFDAYSTNFLQSRWMSFNSLVWRRFELSFCASIRHQYCIVDFEIDTFGESDGVLFDIL